MRCSHVRGEVLEGIYALDHQGSPGLIFHKGKCAGLFEIDMCAVFIYVDRYPCKSFEACVVGDLAVDEVSDRVVAESGVARIRGDVFHGFDDVRMGSYDDICTRIDHLSCEILLVSAGLEGVFIAPVGTYDDNVRYFPCELDVFENLGIDGVEIELPRSGIVNTESVQISVEAVRPGCPVM